MIAHRDDYTGAGLYYFPLNLQVKTVVKILFVLSICMFIVANLLYFLTDFGILYLVVVNILGILWYMQMPVYCFSDVYVCMACLQIFQLSISGHSIPGDVHRYIVDIISTTSFHPNS